eukprot:CAMPEP_0171491148 /NCGR_PEP_ID=MMETSP0958-20121227/3701_1 /TAXON_ID=87120 /ORGANISM="Aurantiochytrium limacinum, Strain ATCCMYA-1381" /LENGTH=1683 /DNA_ID=CAMNT_0012024539 /DNA_START=356 /DNA_END=5407 /DNA_ORIENTATION=+
MEEDDDFMDDLFKDDGNKDKSGKGDEDVARVRKESSLSDMDELFAGITGSGTGGEDDEDNKDKGSKESQGLEHKAKGEAEFSGDSGRDRGDSELDNLFNDIGLSSLSPKTGDLKGASPKRLGSGNSLDDVDTFLQDLDMGSLHSASDHGNSKDKDDFLSWLEEKPSKSSSSGARNSSEITSPTSNSALDTARTSSSDLKTIDEMPQGAKSHDNGLHLDEEDEEDTDDDEEDEIAFYINQPGGGFGYGGQETRSEVSTSVENSSVAKVDESNVMIDNPTLVVPQPEHEGALVPPSINMLLQEEPDSSNASKESADAEAKILTRLETLFEIGQTDASTLLSALRVNNVSGLVLPESRRRDVWMAVLGVKNETPEWASIREERLAEVLSSTRKSIRKDCANAWASFQGQNPAPPSSDDADVKDDPVTAELADLVCRFTLRQPSKIYHSLLCDLAASVYFVFDRDVDATARVLEALSLRWGGRRGDWRCMGLHDGPAQDGLGVGGAAFAKRTLPMNELRRHLLISRMLLYHDPQLGSHLHNACEGWTSLATDLPDPSVGGSGDHEGKSVEKETPPDDATANGEMSKDSAQERNSDDEQISAPASSTSNASQEFLQKGMQRLIKAAHAKNGDAWPSTELLGLFSLQGQNLLAPATRTELWDALVIQGFTPQAFSIYAAVALLILQRDSLLAIEADPTALATKISSLTGILNGPQSESRTGARVGAFAKILASMTPKKVRLQVAEDEMLLALPSQEDLGMFDFRRMRAKEHDWKALQAYEKKMNPDASGDPADDASSTGAAGGTDTEGNKTAKWLSSAFKKTAQDLRSAVASSLNAGKVPIDFEKVFLKRRLVEFNGPPSQGSGLVMRRGKHGLEVTSVTPGSMAERSGLVHIGDLVMTLNGHLVFGLSPSEAEALIALQERPYYIIIATIIPKELQDEVEAEDADSAQKPTCLALTDRIEAYYSRYNPGKEREAERIARIYSHRESVLLEELAFKYDDHVLGDPFVLTTSAYCLPISAEDVVSQVCFKETSNDASNAHNANQGKNLQSSPVRKIFVVDCRPQNVIDRTGRFPTCFVMDPNDLQHEESRKSYAETFAPMRGDMHICILGMGTDVLVADFNPRRARRKLEIDRRRIDACALYFIELGFPLVGVIEGGFLSCYRSLRRLGYQLEDALVNVPADKGALAKYDSYERYRNAAPSVTARFLASKASSVLAQRSLRHAQSSSPSNGGNTQASIPEHPKSRSDTNISFSDLDEPLAGAQAQTQRIVGKASQLLSSYWKKPNASAAAPVEPDDSLTTPAAEEETNASEPADTGIDLKTATQNAASQGSRLFASMWRRQSTPEEKDMAAQDGPVPAKKNNENTNDSETTAPETASEAAKAAAEAADAADAEASKSSPQKTSGWSSGWSSRFKLDTSNLGSKLKSSMNQAYTTAQQKLQAVAEEAERAAQAQAESRAKQQKENDQKAIARIGELAKGDLVGEHEFGRMHRTFEAYKEKTEEKLEKPFYAKRMLVVTPERFLVLDPHPMRPGYSYVKSVRSLRNVVRMRFPNNDPSFITLFYAKSEDDEEQGSSGASAKKENTEGTDCRTEEEVAPVPRTYRFPQDARVFVKALMGACANFNSRHAAPVDGDAKDASAANDDSTKEEGSDKAVEADSSSTAIAKPEDNDDSKKVSKEKVAADDEDQGDDI